MEDHYEFLRQKNALVPVSQLPPELLAKIFFFTFIRRSRESDYEHTNLQSLSKCLIHFNFSQVSHHWRKVALNTPDLWGALTFYHPQFATTMLKRSKMADLVVAADFNHLCQEKHADMVALVVHVLLNDTPRVRELCLTALERLASNLNYFLKGVQEGSLRLRKLHLRTTPDTLEVFPLRLLGGTEDLESLYSESCNFLWPSDRKWSFPRLHTLQLSSVFLPPLSYFIGLLREMPMLEDLAMTDSLPRCDGSAIAIPARLHKLESITIVVNDTLVLSNFLRWIIIPPPKSIWIYSFKWSHGDALQLDHFASSLFTFFSSMNSDEWPTDTGKFLCTALSLKRSAVWHTMSLYRCDGEGFDAAKVMEFGHMNLGLLLQTIFPSIPVHNLRHLTLSIQLPNDILANTVGTLTHLRKLNFTHPLSFFNIIEMLTYQVENANDTLFLSSSAQHSMHIPYPALQILSFDIEGIEFIRRFHNGLALGEIFRDWLLKRREWGAGIDKIEFHRKYYFSATDLKLLRGCVETVEFKTR